MSKIHDIALAPEMQAALLKWLQDMPDHDAATVGDLLPGGFRKPSMIRERLKGIIEGQGPLPPWLLNHITISYPACTAVIALSVQVLREHFDLLAQVADPPKFLIALAADDRPEVRRLALDHLSAASRVVSDTDKDAACSLWMELVDSTLVQLAGITIIPQTTEDGELATDPADVKLLQQQANEQKKTIADLREKLDKERSGRAEDRRQLTATAKAEQDRLTKEISRLKQQLAAFTVEKSALEKKFQDLDLQKAEAVKSAVKSELTSLQRQWLAEAINLDALLSETSTTDLLLHANAVLEAQKAQDRHSGNRLELTRRLQELRAARQQLHETRANAINPITELAIVAEQVDHEIARLESKLGTSRPNDEFLNRLLQEINGSPDLGVLHRSGTLVDSLCEARILTGDQTPLVYSALQRRHDILLVQSKRVGHESLDHWLSFPTLLHRNLDCTLLLDGHNVLFAMDHLQSCFENGKPGLNARNRLITLVQRLINGRANLHARIVFDSPEASVQSVSQNLKVEFSGGNGDHRADDAIVSHLTQKSLQDLKRQTFIVTNDRDLQRRIRTHHAYYMPAGAFDLMLRKFNCL